jgi:hypothetical protein
VLRYGSGTVRLSALRGVLEGGLWRDVLCLGGPEARRCLNEESATVPLELESWG